MYMRLGVASDRRANWVDFFPINFSMMLIAILLAVLISGCNIQNQGNIDDGNLNLEKSRIANKFDANVKGNRRAAEIEKNSAVEAEQRRIVREQDKLLEKALNGETQQQRGELAKSVQLRFSYRQCVKNSDAVMPVLMNCNNEEYEYQDARLNKVYHRLLSKLPADEKVALKQEERDWIKQRDALCQSNGSLGGGQAEELEDRSCELNATAKRADELESR
ncbi:lysozyme inhibitor LprI family protein [Xanthomonas fragariae]|nr:lysozyme inhibitor LprI family protein [Xanthomonas fragariae]SMQ94993.1 Hypothetical Protein NBC2815_01652 [Xanthomonas fragariae]